MEFKHKSVLLFETIDNLNIKPDGIYVDGTKRATCTVDYTDNWSDRCESSEISFWNLSSGEHTVTLKMEEGYYIMDYFVLTKN